jgi:uncharacterized protein (TIGR00255 family)
MRSMTGYGKALARDEHRDVEVEVRSVNNRFLKTQLRLARPVQELESELEGMIRKSVERGTVSLAVRVEQRSRAGQLRIDREALRSLDAQARAIAEELKVAPVSDLSSWLRVPGVIVEDEADAQSQEELTRLVREAVDAAIRDLVAMRRVEGDKLARDLRVITGRLESALAKVQARAPEVVAAHREKLRTRLNAWLDEQGATLDDKDLLREVAVFADRSDVAEEMQRLGSHLEQFETLLSEEGVGRKLDFLAQEMLREVNTIGSKSSDLDLAHAVVDMKSELEKLREQAQNVE